MDTCYWSPGHVKAKQVVYLKPDSRRYVFIDELNPRKKAQFLAAAKTLNKKYVELIENDDFIKALKKQFNASVVIEQNAFNRAMAHKAKPGCS